jgi:hypothetical protein
MPIFQASYTTIWNILAAKYLRRKRGLTLLHPSLALNHSYQENRGGCRVESGLDPTNPFFFEPMYVNVKHIKNVIFSKSIFVMITISSMA